MNREFLVNLFLIVGLNLLIKPIYLFGIDAEIQAKIGEQAYGVYFMLFNYVFLFQWIHDPGLQNYTAQRVAHDRKSLLDEFIPLLSTKLVLAFLSIAFIFSIGCILGFSSSYFELLPWIIGIHICMSLFMWLRSCLGSLGFYRTNSFLSALDKIILIIGLGYILYIRNEAVSIDVFAKAQIGSLSLCCILAFGFIVMQEPMIKWHWDVPIVVKTLQKSWPYGLTLLLMTAYTRIDATMIERLLPDGAYQAGIYAAAYRIHDMLSMLGLLFASLLLPMYVESYKQSQSSFNQLHNLSFRLLAVGAITLTLSIVTYRQEIMLWKFPHADGLYFDTLLILMISFAALTMAYLWGTMFVAFDKVQIINKVFGIGLLINIIGNFIAIPSYGVLGAALVTMVTQIFVGVSQGYFATRNFKVVIESNLWIRLAIWALSSWVIGRVWYQQVHLSTWWIELLLYILICLLMSLIVGVVRLEVLFSQLRKPV